MSRGGSGNLVEPLRGEFYRRNMGIKQPDQEEFPLSRGRCSPGYKLQGKVRVRPRGAPDLSVVENELQSVIPKEGLFGPMGLVTPVEAMLNNS